MKALDFLAEDYPLVDKNETLYYTFKLMEKYDLYKAVVYEKTRDEKGREYKKITGIITGRDIVLKLATQRIRLTTPGRLHVSSFMSLNPITISPDTGFSDMVKVMYEKSIGILPVLRGNDIIGIVLREKLLEVLKKDDTEVRFVMNTYPLIARTSDRILKIRQDMLNNDVSFMPVLDEKNEIVGYITIAELAYALFKFQDIVPAKHKKERITHLIVEDIMRFRPPKLRITDTIATALSYILEKRSRGAIVVDEIGSLAGVVTVHDLLRYMVEKQL